MSIYAGTIKTMTKQDPAIIEAFIRVEHHELDHLSPMQFFQEVKIAEACIKEMGIEAAREFAKTYKVA